jgi:hypothetical protein
MWTSDKKLHPLDCTYELNCKTSQIAPKGMSKQGHMTRGTTRNIRHSYTTPTVKGTLCSFPEQEHFVQCFHVVFCRCIMVKVTNHCYYQYNGPSLGQHLVSLNMKCFCLLQLLLKPHELQDNLKDCQRTVPVNLISTLLRYWQCCWQWSTQTKTHYGNYGMFLTCRVIPMLLSNIWLWKKLLQFQTIHTQETQKFCKQYLQIVTYNIRLCTAVLKPITPNPSCNE